MAAQLLRVDAEAVESILNKFQCQQWSAPFVFPENLSRVSGFCLGGGPLREMWS